MTLYTAPGCCLCEELKGQLLELQEEFSFKLQELDISGNPQLEARYRTELPVLLINGRKAVKYRISMEALRQRLRYALGLGGNEPRRLR